MNDEPQYFTLLIGVCFCRPEIRVNDIPVFATDVSTSRVDFEVPLNPLVFTGENSLVVKILPAQASDQSPSYGLDNAHVECSVTLCRRPYAREMTERTALASIVFRGGDPTGFGASSLEGDGAGPLQHVYEPAQHALAARTVVMQTPFPEWRWVRAPAIEPTSVTFRELLAENQRFWNALRNRDTAELRAIMAVNARELQSAYYLPTLDDAWRVIGIEELMRNPEAQLKPMPTDVKAEIFANGRMARVVTDDGASPIYFHEGDTGLDAQLAAWYCRGPAGSWIMIR